MKILATVLTLLLCSCALEIKPGPDVEATLKQHSAVLAAMASYFGELQEKGILPKPEPVASPTPIAEK